MSMDKDEKIKEILKTIVSFDVETDLEDEEAREELVKYFGELVDSDSDVSKNFLSSLIDDMGNILANMNIIEPEEKEEESNDGGEEEDLTNLSEPEEDLTSLAEPEDETAEEGLDITKLRSIADRANDFLIG